MRQKLELQARVSHNYKLKKLADDEAFDTSELRDNIESEEPIGAFASTVDGSEPDQVERVEVVGHPREDLPEGLILLVGRTVSFELSVDELEAAIAALRATDKVRRYE